ncbi:basic amino acid ABC transporter substrate-binding protein [Fervidobacterium pennivorans subsp. shakshaketiis]|jgi:polar amino acid transport system substrate-binding protein|uniref:Amino acid ABC transporter substrate-binding protein, PAAT family n=1 Tax=Fervidobacterium pennivorans (strain DSM 9078 / Ven5) TaxID=771875 RepID=H9UCQ3_FERPD|nr:basic amino acid ABC transporter substrate-binding protein [Fervidobacterium pennivorans]AFG35296.1 amino acid ABC transporter substrate-binding protein, PAAT family [Fervidobacterium pennivorans DSM 9078]QIV78341.1 basic amino acid ABC transporter substrate-binding protein [Fervidobacterium pennivorans subsp. keratinolyticus]
MKRIAVLVLLVAIVIVVTLSFAQSLTEIKKRGKLIVGTEPTFPPFEFVDEKNQVVGFDIDIANELAKRLGVKLEIVNLPFDSLIPALLQGKIDLIIAGMTITEERAKVVDFSKPYFEANQAIVVRKDGRFEPKKLEELVGKKVAVQLGTTGDLVISEINGIQVVRFQKFTDAFLELQNGRVDAVVLDEAPAKAYVKKFPKFLISAVIDTGETYGIAVKKGNKELLNFVNQTLDILKGSGVYNKLIQKWFE